MPTAYLKVEGPLNAEGRGDSLNNPGFGGYVEPVRGEMGENQGAGCLRSDSPGSPERGVPVQKLRGLTKQGEGIMASTLGQ